MAEFCFDCYKKHFDEDAKKEHLVIGKSLELCEGCGKYKQTVIKQRRDSIFKRIFRGLKKINQTRGRTNIVRPRLLFARQFTRMFANIMHEMLSDPIYINRQSQSSIKGEIKLWR